MLEQLVESKDNAAENKRRFGFLTTTLFTVGIIFLAALTYSLFAKDLGANDEGLDFSSLVAPVPVTNEKPEPIIRKEPESQSAAVNQNNQPTRRDMFAKLDDSRNPPTDTMGEKDVQSWVKGAQLSKINSNPNVSPTDRRGNDGPGEGLNIPGTSDENTEVPPEPKAKTQPKAEPPKTEKPTIMQTGGVVNGKATNLVKPIYPPPAKAVNASGAVNVQVVIDEQGNVISATAVSGHQLLRPAAEKAARSSKFSPTFLSKVPVKVTGVIVYNFVAQ